MISTLVNKYSLINRLAVVRPHELNVIRFKTHKRTGAVLPMPKVASFGIFGVLCSVVPGLFIGAAISKTIANFLEENDLFVPSDDDDDED